MHVKRLGYLACTWQIYAHRKNLLNIVILVGGNSDQGNAEHRFLVGQFLERFDKQVTCIVTAKPQKRPAFTRLKRLIRRGNYAERLARIRYGGHYGPDADSVRQLLLPEEVQPNMPGGDRVSVVPSHNSEACRKIIENAKPDVIVVYGTAIIHEPIFSLAQKITLNMHTGLSPYYRGDSTLFWPVYYNEPDKLGVTVHELVASVDGGDIAATGRVHYESGDSEADLFAKGVKTGTSLYLDVVGKALAGTLNCTAQNLALGREFSWRDRTVEAERQVLAQLKQWEDPTKSAA